ncbi:MAG: hypothetical protein IH626_09085 [Rhodospirillales bacterium]|nr:hypothetical protein [Rhodospirillales bacterium]
MENSTPNLLTLERHLNFSEALVVHSFLLAHGIPAVLADEYFLRVHWLRLFALGGASIQVPSSAADDARTLLQSVRSEYDGPQPGEYRSRKKTLALLLLALSG